MMKLVAFSLAWHAMAGPVKEWADKYEELTYKMSAHSFGLLSNEQKMKTIAAYSGLFDSTGIDCSFDPYNPIIGYNLKDTTYEKCVMTHYAMIQKAGKMEANRFSVVDTIVDEEESKLAIFVEFGNTGRFREKFTVRAAFRMKISDGKANGWHAVGDSYALLPKEAETLAVQAPSTGAHMVLGAALLGLGFLSAQIFQKKKKSNLLLDEQVVA
jgi:hypothetical protein